MKQSKESKILLSRCDSDDFLHKDFVKETQQEKFMPKRILTYFKGYVLFIDKPPLWRRLKWLIGRILTKKI